MLTKPLPRRRGALGGALAVGAIGVILALTMAATPAAAISISYVPNATLNVGQSRNIVGDWNGTGPFKYDYKPNTPGNANFANPSTSQTELFKPVAFTECMGFTGTHVLKVWERAGAGALATASTKTVWVYHGFC